MILGPTLGRLGKRIGDHPCLSLFSSTALLITAVIYLFLRPPATELGIDKGLTTRDAPSFAEMRAQEKFFGDNGRPWYMALFAEPTSANGSMIDSSEFYHVESFYRKIKSVPLRYDEVKQKNITYLDLCGSTCKLNELLFTTYKLSWFGINYPISHIFTYKSNIAKHFYDVRTVDGEIKQANLTMLVFMAFSNEPEVRKDLELFEKSSQSLVDEYNKQTVKPVRFILHGENGMKDAVQDGISSAALYLLKGFVLVVLIFFCIFLIFSKLFERFTIFHFLVPFWPCVLSKLDEISFLMLYRIPLLWVTGLCVPVAAFIVSLAAYSLLGYSVTMLTFLAPIFVFLFALDGVILLSHTWLGDTELNRDSPGEHMLEVFATCMPSIIITTSTAFGFLIAAFFPIPNYASLSVFIGLSQLFVLFYLMFFFAPLMLVIAPAVKFNQVPQNGFDSHCDNDCIFVQTKNSFCNHVANSKWLKIAGLLLLVGGVAVPVAIGLRYVNGNLDYRQFLKPDSPRNEGVHFMSDIVWPQYFSIIFFITNPPDFSNPIEYKQYKNMIAEIENIDGKHLNETDMTWINDFCAFTNTNPHDDALNTTLFKNFITDNIYKAWADGLKFEYDENGKAIIKNMVHIVAFSGTKSLAEKAVLYGKSREITNKYPQFLAYPFDTEVGLGDIIVQMTGAFIFIPLFALGSMFICSIFIFGNITVSVLNLTMVFIIYSSSLSFPTLLGFDLNPFTVTFLLLSAGLAPKFTTHFCYFYQQAKRTNSKAVRQDRLHETLRKSLVPVLMSCVCSTCLLLPTLAAPISIFREFSVTNLVLNTIGFVISFFFLQVSLTTLPETLTGTHFLLSPIHQN